MKYQKGTVYPRGTEGEDVVRQVHRVLTEGSKERRSASGAIFALCPKANTPKWKAEQMLHGIILKETGVPAEATTAIPR